MDISPPPPPTTATATATTTTKSLDPDTRIHPTTTPKQLPPPFSNGVLKRHKPRHLHHHNIHPPPVVVTYRECLKNHAATMGGHAVDGCGEFMPSPTSTPTDPTSLKCAACGCHRNFHRRDPDESFPSNPVQHVIEYQPHHRHHPPPPPPPPPPQPISVTATSPTDSPSPPPISSSYYPSAPHMLLALSTGTVSAPPPENHNHHHPSIPITAGVNPNAKKRFRTKFTQDQKEKMHELAERVGWKMQKRDEDLIIAVCNQIGVDRSVFKVWMHNNKMTLGIKKDSNTQNDDGSYGGGVGIDFLTTHNHHRHQNHHNHQHLYGQPEMPPENNNDSISSGGGNVNGSSSSS